MNKSLHYPLLLAVVVALASCTDDDKLDVTDITVPDGYALSAGTATGFFNSSVAYDQDASWVSGAYNTRFHSGDRLYDNVKSADSNGHGGGLGPVYAGYSCGSCHRTSYPEGGSAGGG